MQSYDPISPMAVNSATRKQRRPVFPIAGTLRPFGLQPLAITMMLPGETMQALTCKGRVISQPLKNPLGGAWLETFAFFVKLTDLDRTLGQMFITDTMPTTGWTAAADQPRYFTKAGQIEWVKRCALRVHQEYFTHDNETQRFIDTDLPLCKLNHKSWYSSSIREAADIAVPTNDGGDQFQHMQNWFMLQQMSLTELTYEKYLETYGGKAPEAVLGRPELWGFHQAWTLPVNTVEPTTGVPSGAWVWNFDMKIEKPKRAQEPGFLIVMAVVRPKLFQKNVAASLLGEFWGFSDFFPSYNLMDPAASIKRVLSTAPVYAAAAQDAGVDNVLYDHKDLLLHGEAFVSNWSPRYAIPATTGLEVKAASEPEDLRGEYPRVADIDNLFAGALANQREIFYDGMIAATISGHLVETTPTYRGGPRA